MGTSLTGTKPKDTYDSLIKVGDNGPISGTAKTLSDGLGNDLPIAVSTSNVGIGTSSPSQKLHVAGGNLLVNNGTSPDSNSGIRIVAPISTTEYNWMIAAQQNLADEFEITPSTAVGGTTFSAPILSANAISKVVTIASGIKFPVTQVASADPNTLDDYEEGTWTPNFTLDSGSVSAYTSSGSYTKIGRQVSATMTIAFTTTVSASINEITGLPFTAQNLPQNAIGAVRESSNTGTIWQWRINANSTQGLLRKYDNTQSISNGDTFIGTLTYFV